MEEVVFSVFGDIVDIVIVFFFFGWIIEVWEMGFDVVDIVYDDFMLFVGLGGCFDFVYLYF